MRIRGRLRRFAPTGGANPDERAVESGQNTSSHGENELLVHAPAQFVESLPVYLAKFLAFARLGPSGAFASVSGGRNRMAEGDFDWVAGSLVEDE